MEFYGFNSYTTSHQTAKFYNLEPSSGSGGNFTKKRFKYAVPMTKEATDYTWILLLMKKKGIFEESHRSTQKN